MRSQRSARIRWLRAGATWARVWPGGPAGRSRAGRALGRRRPRAGSGTPPPSARPSRRRTRDARCPFFKSPADKAASPRQEPQDILTLVRKSVRSGQTRSGGARDAPASPGPGTRVGKPISEKPPSRLPTELPIQSRLTSFSEKATPESLRDYKSTFKRYSHPMSHSLPHPVWVTR